MYRMLCTPALQYTLPVGNIPSEALKSMQTNLLKTFTQKMKFRSNLTNSIMFGPRRWCDLSLLESRFEQGLGHFKMLFGHLPENKSSASAIHTCLSTLQLEMGLVTPILASEYSTYYDMSRGLDQDNMEVSCGLQDHCDVKVLDPKTPPRGRHFTNGIYGTPQRRTHTSTNNSDQPVSCLLASDIRCRYDKQRWTVHLEIILPWHSRSFPALDTMAMTNETSQAILETVATGPADVRWHRH
jgi:hypothetical protein